MGISNFEINKLKISIFPIVIVPDEYLGTVLELCTSKRGVQINLNYTGMRALVEYKLPLNEQSKIEFGYDGRFTKSEEVWMDGWS